MGTREKNRVRFAPISVEGSSMCSVAQTNMNDYSINKPSNILYFLPTCTGRKESINQFKENVMLRTADITL